MAFLSDRGLERVNRAVVSDGSCPPSRCSRYPSPSSRHSSSRCSTRRVRDARESLWWSAQTITTVGYGDVIPQTAFSKMIAVFVIIFGVSTVALITAVISSSVIACSPRRLAAVSEHHEDVRLAALERIERRLEALEQRLR